MADYFQIKNQNIFNPPANTNLGNVTNQFNDAYIQNDLILGNVTVTSDTIITPRITTIAYPGDDTAADPAGGQTITLTGTGFVVGASVFINGSVVGVVSVVSSTTITFTSPANVTGSYVIYVVNPDGSTAIAIPGIQYSGTPNWTTAAGTLGNVYETASFNQTVTATGDAPITYSVVTGSIPPGSTFNANGTITGTSQLSASPTTYSFTVRATDAQLQDTNRAFSISVIPDVVTWSNPTNNATYSPIANVAIANITLSATSAVGSGITYSANTLPTGLSLTGANIAGTPTVVANTSSLLTATANTTTESSSITINWVVSVSGDPYFMYNSLLLPGTGTNNATNNTFLDSSTNNFTITRNGNTTQGTNSPYGLNWSSYNSDTPDSGFGFNYNVALSMSTGDFTVEAWVNTIKLPTVNSFQTGAGGFQCVFATGPNQSASGTSLYIGVTNLKFDITSDGSGPIDIAHNMVAGQWYHVAVSRSGNTFRAFINGSLVQTATSSSSWSDGYGYGIQRAEPVGGFTGGWWYGYVSNFRAVKGTAVYTSAFTPSTTPLTAISGTSLLTCQSNRFNDNSSNNFSPVFSPNPPIIQRYSPFSPTAPYSTNTIGGAGYFDGTGDYLSLANNAAFTVGTGAVTIEAWIYCTSLTQTYQGIIGGRLQDSGTDYPGLSLVIDNSKLVFTIMGASTGLTDTNNVSLNQWLHVVGVRSGTNAALFVNGVRKVFTTSNSVNGSSSNMAIGRYYSASDNYYFSGYISDALLVKGTAVYDPTVATLTVPTAPLTAVANTSLLINFTNAGIIDNTMMNNLETVGDAKISTAQSKFGGGSMYFDGAGDYLTQPSSQNFNFGTGDFTMEGWFYQTGLASSYPAIISNPLAFNQAGAWGLLSSHASTGVRKLQFFCYNADSSNPFLLGTTTLSDNTWYYFALTRSGTTFRLFLNGTVEATATFSGSLTSVSSSLVVGINQTSYPFQGYINDLRITKGYARYTTTFTPPTSALLIS